MAIPALELSSSPALSTDAALIVLGVSRGSEGPELVAPADAYPELRGMLAALEVTGAADEYRRAPATDGSPVPFALIGLGAAATRESLRSAAGAAGRRSAGVESLSIALPVADADQAEAVLEAAGSGAYAYLAYKTGKGLDAKRPPQRIVLHVVPELDVDGVAERAASTATAVHTVRDLVNMPPVDLYP